MKRHDHKILGLTFFNRSYDELIKQINQEIHNQANCMIITPTTEILGVSMQDEYLTKILASSTLLLPDSVSLIWVSKLLRKSFDRRVTGIDTLYRLGKNKRKTYKVYYLGAKEAVLKKAVEVSTEIFPSFEIVGSHHGYYSADETKAVIKDINSSKADILFVGLGFPKQEQFIYEHRKDIHVPVKITVGGSFDVISGVLKRAPLWMQKIALEWAFRLIQEPSRIKRMSLIPVYLIRILYLEISGKHK
ncbi:MAG: hypothetical protein A2Y40_01925 [Candidatus Margulisbacteria bacterium GWF2_35_9]|nr:MAG: hypothetical protein A2Y40_01925 [Candidatus Margulisbacteria bacterium GWF2_35_9]